MSKTMRAIGLMSGTSMDGIDVALIDTDGADSVARGPALTVAYDEAFRSDLRRAIADARQMADRTARPGSLAGVERELTEHHAAAVAQFLAQQGLRPAEVDVIGFHGQTVLHKRVVDKVYVRATGPDTPSADVVEAGHMLTVQIGDGGLLARRTGINVVYDLRAADVAAGGQGAPLAPVYHRALAPKQLGRPIVVLNIGGVANATWIGPDGALIAFDTGPGNGLIDDWAARHTGQPMDEGGKLAAAGRVDEDAMLALLTHDHFGALPPKSLDRHAFSLAAVERLSPADGAATLTAFTAASVARAREHFPIQPRMWIVSGGGRHNRTLMAMIAGRVDTAVAPAEAAGMDGDALEAEAWAYLAVRSLKGLPITFPGTTGVPHPLTGGVVARTP